MAAKDKFHEAVRHALQKDGWTVTDDPLKLEFGGTKPLPRPELEFSLGKVTGFKLDAV